MVATGVLSREFLPIYGFYRLIRPSAFAEFEDTLNAIVAKIDSLTKENGAGEFRSFDDTAIDR